MPGLICLLATATALLLQFNLALGCVKPLIDSRQKPSYMGCFEDRSNDRDLKSRVGYAEDMTPMKCFQMCKMHKSEHIGLQRGNECWCGDQFGLHGRANEASCNLGCAGNKEENCGGKSQNAIYTGAFNGFEKTQKIEQDDSHLQ